MVRLDLVSIFSLPHRHVAVPREQFIHDAAEIRREMLHDDECHSRIRRQVREELFE